MEDVSSEVSGIVTSPRIDGNTLSFNSGTHVKGFSPVGVSPSHNGNFRMNRNDAVDITQRPYVGLQRDVDILDDEDLTYDSSGLAIPRLRESMTPWRTTESKIKKDPKLHASRAATLVDNQSPTNSRPETRNSLFSLDGAYTVASSTTNDLEHLQKQLTTYKLKVRTLLELIKQLNYGDDEQKNRDSFYGKLLSTLSQSDEVDELRKQLTHVKNNNGIKQKRIDELENDISQLSEQLASTKKEHAETLEYANEYLEHSELLAKNIDEMLYLLLENIDLPNEERDALQKTIQISSSFAMVKINALMTTFSRVLQDLKSSGLKSQEVEVPEHDRNNSATIEAIANSTGINEVAGSMEAVNEEKNDEFSINESAIDTRLEVVIEGLHQEYDKFFHGIRSKIEKSAELEKLLLSRLSQQDKLLSRIAAASDMDSQQQDSHCQKHDSILSSIDETSKRASLELSKSYKDHIDNLNSLVHALNSTMSEKNAELQQLKRQLKDQELLRKTEQKLKNEIKEYKDMCKLKENNWESFANDLEESVRVLQIENDQMSEVVNQLHSELKMKEDEIEEISASLQETQRRVRDISNLHREDKLEFRNELSDKMREIESLNEERDQIRVFISETEKTSMHRQKYAREFQCFKDHLLLHLEKVFNTLGKILQQTSVDQSKRKLEVIRRMDGLTATKTMQTKLESLYNFIETAQESIVESYTTMILLEGERRSTEGTSNKEMQLRIEELERKWISERERRKLDITAAESRISRLEAENELLREKLYNSTMRK